MSQMVRAVVAAIGVFFVTLSLHGAATNTWYASNSPIVVTTNVTIPGATALIIQAGTTVQFGLGINLVVANGGVLLAEGSSNAPIHFTRSGASGFWGSITINGAVGSPESRITYATFDFNTTNLYAPCIDVNAGTAFLDHLTFRNTATPYIHVDGASFDMDVGRVGFSKCEVIEKSRAGIHIDARGVEIGGVEVKRRVSDARLGRTHRAIDGDAPPESAGA